MVSGLSAGLLAGRRHLNFLLGQSENPFGERLLVASGSSCALTESFAGYQAALAASGITFRTACWRSLSAARMLILPATVFRTAVEVFTVKALLKTGSTVLLECGANFVNPAEFEFQKRLIHTELGLRLHAPVELWVSSAAFRHSPYLDYEWPIAVKVRDFSRVIPIDCGPGEAIAWVRGKTVAAKLQVGKGSLIFLGSPMGPHLLAGDREAHRWFSQCCSLA
jgi:hypothetical protein